jgi:hypothetical protein
MRDPYAWIDPFEEIERLDAHAVAERLAGRRDGANEACAFLERENDEQYRRIVHRELTELGRRTAQDMFARANMRDRIQKGAYDALMEATRRDLEMQIHMTKPVLLIYPSDGPDGLRLDFVAGERLHDRS